MGNDTPSAADTGPTAAKRPRLQLRSTKSELFIVNSELSRDTTDTDGSCDATIENCVGQTVSSLVTAVSEDSVDSSSNADMSQNSITTVTTGSADTVCQAGTDVVSDEMPSADLQSGAVEACTRLTSYTFALYFAYLQLILLQLCSAFTARCTIVQSEVLRSHVIRLSDVGGL